MNEKDLIDYLIEEANAFNAGAPWGTSSFSNLIIEVVARYLEKYHNISYSTTNRLYNNMALHNVLDMVGKEAIVYREQHPETVLMLEYLAAKL